MNPYPPPSYPAPVYPAQPPMGQPYMAPGPMPMVPQMAPPGPYYPGQPIVTQPIVAQPLQGQVVVPAVRDEDVIASFDMTRESSTCGFPFVLPGNTPHFRHVEFFPSNITNLSEGVEGKVKDVMEEIEGICHDTGKCRQIH